MRCSSGSAWRRRTGSSSRSQRCVGLLALSWVHERAVAQASRANPRSCRWVLTHSLFVMQPCGPSNFEKLRVREMDQYLSFWNLMACVSSLPPPSRPSFEQS